MLAFSFYDGPPSSSNWARMPSSSATGKYLRRRATVNVTAANLFASWGGNAGRRTGAITWRRMVTLGQSGIAIDPNHTKVAGAGRGAP
jgi:hypothetical protein